MSKVTAINIIIKKKNQLRKHKEGYVSYINIDEVLVWLNDIQKELEDQNMDRNQAKEFYPFLQAFAEGKIIETRRKQSAVKGTSVPNDWTEIKEIGYWDNIEYRVKPEPKYRPFKDAEECWTEMQKHQPFGWVKTGESIRRLITLVDVDRIQQVIKI